MKIYDNVDYDYPQCGGLKVYKGYKYYRVVSESNYSGNYTGREYLVEIAIADTAEEAIEAVNHYPECRGVRLHKKGLLVQ